MVHGHFKPKGNSKSWTWFAHRLLLCLGILVVPIFVEVNSVSPVTHQKPRTVLVDFYVPSSKWISCVWHVLVRPTQFFFHPTAFAIFLYVTPFHWSAYIHPVFDFLYVCRATPVCMPIGIIQVTALSDIVFILYTDANLLPRLANGLGLWQIRRCFVLRLLETRCVHSHITQLLYGVP